MREAQSSILSAAMQAYLAYLTSERRMMYTLRASEQDLQRLQEFAAGRGGDKPDKPPKSAASRPACTVRAGVTFDCADLVDPTKLVSLAQPRREGCGQSRGRGAAAATRAAAFSPKALSVETTGALLDASADDLQIRDVAMFELFYASGLPVGAVRARLCGAVFGAERVGDGAG
ncbi:MAG: hypothetical protein IPL70_07225 [Uliginosibacterium sp.]|nr:hypothetical protein [Uliginosibacterium sp.]